MLPGAVLFVFLGFFRFGVAVFPVPHPEFEAMPRYWHHRSYHNIKYRLEQKENRKHTRKVVLFLGDGMGLSTVTAARIYKGQATTGSSGEESLLAWDRFPHVSLSRTYGLDAQTSDSANSATAYLCGVKANFRTIGVDSRVKGGQCHNNTDTYLTSIMSWAQAVGMATGVVTTTKLTDATPAATYAHVGHRHWQAKVPEGCNAHDIAHQLVHEKPGNRLKVILGGGRSAFLRNNRKGEKGDRIDGRNLIREWQKSKEGLNGVYVDTGKALCNVDTSKTEYLLGMFSSEHLPYVEDRQRNGSDVPSLETMTMKALDILEKSPNGYLLLVEGGRIDHAHHQTSARLALEETLELDRTVEQTVRRLGTTDALVVVTADHSHSMTISGYPQRGNNILGIAGYSDVDQLPFTTLSYATGPRVVKKRENFTEEETTARDYRQYATFPRKKETHGGEDVAVYAIGPWSHLYSGCHDQTFIPNVIAYASCIGAYAKDWCYEDGYW